MFMVWVKQFILPEFYLQLVIILLQFPLLGLMAKELIQEQLLKNNVFHGIGKFLLFEKTPTLKDDDGRDVRTSNYGIYKIKVSVPSESKNIFFKVSKDPVNDSVVYDSSFCICRKISVKSR